ncbi:Endoribonuclease Dicer4 [Sesamum angolense]|uniref:Endoribonuclease Dicer4 n=1 Tax=Sesamum angolense TaxID=2727404 RepID=A0AAE1WDJ5_9LAMI|nr:Endoribonuclease Dicer4 [Sesamum angolense]
MTYISCTYYSCVCFSNILEDNLHLILERNRLIVLTVCLVPAELTEEWQKKEEHFIELPPEICQLKVIGFSKDIGSSLFLLPSILHRLESFLVAIELKEKLVASFPEGAEVTAQRRLEFLGDAVFDYLITSYLYSVYPNLKPGQLTDLRSVSVNNTSFADVAGRWSFHKFIICDSSVLREKMTEYVNSTGSSTTGKRHIEEKKLPKGSYFLLDLSVCTTRLFLILVISLA